MILKLDQIFKNKTTLNITYGNLQKIIIKTQNQRLNDSILYIFSWQLSNISFEIDLDSVHSPRLLFVEPIFYANFYFSRNKVQYIKINGKRDISARPCIKFHRVSEYILFQNGFIVAEKERKFSDKTMVTGNRRRKFTPVVKTLVVPSKPLGRHGHALDLRKRKSWSIFKCIKQDIKKENQKLSQFW